MAARRREAGRRNWPQNLYQNSQGYFWYRDPSTGKTYGLGRDQKAATLQVRTVNAELALRAGDANLLSRIDSQQRTLAQFCDEYSIPIRARLADNKFSLWNFENEMDTIKDSAFAHKSIVTVSARDIVELLTSTAERGASVPRKIRTRLAHVFREAINLGFVEAGKNPVTSTFQPKRSVARGRLSLEDFIAIREKIAESGAHTWAVNAMNLALVTGQRRSDILNMQFSDVREGFLWVVQQKTKTGLKLPTSLSLREASLNLADVISECRTGQNTVSKYMVHSHRRVRNPNVAGKLTPNFLSGMFAKYRELAGVAAMEGKTPATFHEIRSLSARLYAQQFGNEFAKTLLGHKSDQMAALYRDSRGSGWLEVTSDAA